MGRNQEPVALISLHPEDLRITEIILGAAFRRIEEDITVLGPVLAVRACRMHDAFLALAGVSGIIMTCIEKMISAVLILHDAAGSQRGVRLGHQSVIERHAVVRIA